MVDLITVLSATIAALSLTWAILATLVPKRKELRVSFGRTRTRIIDQLSVNKVSGHAIGFLMIFAALLGATLYYSLPMSTGLIFITLFFVWFLFALVIFRNPRWETRQSWSRREIEAIVQQRLKEEREKSATATASKET